MQTIVFPTPADQKNILAYIHDRLTGGSAGQLSADLKVFADKAISAKSSGSQESWLLIR